MNSRLKNHKLICIILILVGVSIAGTPISSMASQDNLQIFDQENSMGSVAILIIDDFGFEDPPGDFGVDDLCTVTPGGQARGGARGMSLIAGFARGGARGMSVEVVHKPHGMLVYEKFMELLSNATATTYSSGSEIGLNWIGRINGLKVHQDAPEIFLVQVDTSGYSTTVITDRIYQAIYTLESTWGIKRFVLNMSFGVVPCDLGDDYYNYLALVQSNVPLQDLKNELLWLMGGGDKAQRMIDMADELSDEAQHEYLLGLLRTQLAYGTSPASIDWRLLEYDPLHDILGNPRGYTGLDINVISVAAAGNHGKEYPFAPALWDEVISVSAPPAYGDEVIEYSNLGEVMMGGAFQDYLGTSFSAPELSYRAALYLLKGGYEYLPNSGLLTCYGENGVTTPPLTYGKASGPWYNMPFDDAAEDYCFDFLNLDLTSGVFTAAGADMSEVIAGLGIAGSNDYVYAWYNNNTVSSGSISDLDQYRTLYNYGLPRGKSPYDIVGMGIAGSDDHIYVWFRDGSVSSGNSGDLTAYRGLYEYEVPRGKSPDDIVGMGIAGSNDYVYTWYRDGTVSSGSSGDLDAYRDLYTYSLPSGKSPDDIVGVGIAGSNDYVYTWYRDGTVSVGTSSVLDNYQSPIPYSTP